LDYATARKIVSRNAGPKAAELLLLEYSALDQIAGAYTETERLLIRDMKIRWKQITAGEKKLTDYQKRLFMRNKQLVMDIDKRLFELTAKVDIIDEKALWKAVGISDKASLKEIKVVTFFDGLDEKSFARINKLQSEYAVDKSMKGIKAVNEMHRTDMLKGMREQLQIATIKGEGIEEIVKRFVSKTALSLEGVNKGVFSNVEVRARLNARWGIIESANNAAEIQYMAFNERCAAADIKTRIGKQLIAHLDRRTTEICATAHGQIQEVGVPFETIVGMIMYPPFHANCRSSVAAWHKAFEKYGRNTAQMEKDGKAWIRKYVKLKKAA